MAASPPLVEQAGPGLDPAAPRLVAANVSELVVGRKLKFPIYGDNDELLLAEGIVITAEFSRRLKQRAIHTVKVHSDDIAQATLASRKGRRTGLELDTAVAEQIDTIIDGGLLFVANSEPAVLTQMTMARPSDYNRRRTWTGSTAARKPASSSTTSCAMPSKASGSTAAR